MSIAFSTLKSTFVRTQRIHIQKLSLSSARQLRINLLVIAGLVLLAVGYIGLVNSLATKGYKIKELQQRIAVLSDSNEKMQLATIEAQSFDALQHKVATLGLISSEHIDYIEGNTTVAVR